MRILWFVLVLVCGSCDSPATFGELCATSQDCDGGLTCETMETMGEDTGVEQVCTRSCEDGTRCPSLFWCFQSGYCTDDGFCRALMCE